MTSHVLLKSRYIAAMVLAGSGDSMGYNHGAWEFAKSGKVIHQQVINIGGLSSLHASRKNGFCVSDDTIMHLATARALVKSQGIMKDDEKLSMFAQEYIECMADMDGRSPGVTCISSCDWLEKKRNSENPKEYRVPFNPRSGGCGAAMRSMCIGLRYSKPEDLEELIKVAVESGRSTHHHPTGYLGGVVAAVFTSFAMQDIPVISWGAKLMNTVLPTAQGYIEKAGFEVEPNLHSWLYFVKQWSDYLALRQIDSGTDEPVFPDPYGVEERDLFYSKISYSGWGGASGHDSTIIAYDALLGCKGSWEELCSRAVFHGGDNDSTGTIAASWYGAIYGLDPVYAPNHEEVEYRDEMVSLAEKLFEISQGNSGTSAS